MHYRARVAENLKVPLFVKFTGWPAQADFAPFMKTRFELQGTRWDSDDVNPGRPPNHPIDEANNRTRWRETPVYVSGSGYANCEMRGVFVLHSRGGHTRGAWYSVQYSFKGTAAYNVVARSQDVSINPISTTAWEVQQEQLSPRKVPFLDKMTDTVTFESEENWGLF